MRKICNSFGLVKSEWQDESIDIKIHNQKKRKRWLEAKSLEIDSNQYRGEREAATILKKLIDKARYILSSSYTKNSMHI